VIRLGTGDLPARTFVENLRDGIRNRVPAT
jgi:hypothetical protein